MSNTFFEEYKKIGEEIENIFAVNYKTKDRYVQFIYFGYDEYEPTKPKSEDSRFVLIDTKNQTWEFGHFLTDAIKFLKLDNEQIQKLKNDIIFLNEKEIELRNLISDAGFIPKIVYHRKLQIMLRSIEQIQFY
jgi:hypothetical protein